MSVADLYQRAGIRNWGEIRSKCNKMGQPISPQDDWIAATARQHSLLLVTHNPEHCC